MFVWKLSVFSKRTRLRETCSFTENENSLQKQSFKIYCFCSHQILSESVKVVLIFYWTVAAIDLLWKLFSSTFFKIWNCKLRSDSPASPLWCLDAELWIRAIKFIASYESSAWQGDSSGLTAKLVVLFSLKHFSFTRTQRCVNKFEVLVSHWSEANVNSHENCVMQYFSSVTNWTRPVRLWRNVGQSFSCVSSLKCWFYSRTATGQTASVYKLLKIQDNRGSVGEEKECHK